MDKNKVDNNKYTYNIVDGEYSDNEGESGLTQVKQPNDILKMSFGIPMMKMKMWEKHLPMMKMKIWETQLPMMMIKMT